MEFQKIGHPFFNPPYSSPGRIFAMSFSTTPVEEPRFGNRRRRQKTSQESRHRQNLEAQKRFQAQNYRLLHFVWKIWKNIKNEDPCRRSATPVISGDAKKSLVWKKSCYFAWEGWSKLKNAHFSKKKYVNKFFLNEIVNKFFLNENTLNCHNPSC